MNRLDQCKKQLPEGCRKWKVGGFWKEFEASRKELVYMLSVFVDLAWGWAMFTAQKGKTEALIKKKIIIYSGKWEEIPGMEIT